MRRIIYSILFIACMCTAANAETKIGFVDMKAVIAKSEPGMKAMESLKSQFKDMKGNLDAQKKSLDTLKEELQKQAMMLSQEAKMEKENQYKRKIRDFQDMGQNYQQKLQQAEQNLSKPIIEKLLTILQEYGKKNGYTAIFDKQGSAIMYHEASTDLTDAIIAELNKAMRGK